MPEKTPKRWWLKGGSPTRTWVARAPPRAGQQDRTEHGSPWPRMQRGYREQQQADPLPETGIGGPADRRRRFSDDRQRRDLHGGVHRQKQDHEARQGATDPN